MNLLPVLLGFLFLFNAPLTRAESPLQDKPQVNTPLNQVKNTRTNLIKYLSKKDWDRYFPNRYGKAKIDGQPLAKDFYTYEAFVAAAKLFPKFLAEGDMAIQKRELAAFLAHMAQETSGGWKEAPGGFTAWGLYMKEEKGCDKGCPQYTNEKSLNYPPVAGVSYHGRGPKQLSWNYNYGQFSEAYYGDKNILLQQPDKLLNDAVLAFASAIWFWMTPQRPKPSCHDVMTGNWQPTEADIKNNRRPGFGTTLNIINGGVECGKAPVERTLNRYEYYKHFCALLHAQPGDNATCTDQRPFTEQ